ncbi:DEAD/DEAH box helicase family protein [bacterium]|nr:DEAD/DEAH box helicase family protein [candidate division CSSED10-310 bacterium]
MTTPEQKARSNIDQQLEQSGWAVQSRDEINLRAGRGVAIRELHVGHGHGVADYLLFVDEKPVGVVEAKKEGHTLSGVAPQAEKYADGMPGCIEPPITPLPFRYLSTGVITKFFNNLDPRPRTRTIFQFHRPETFAEWLRAETLDTWVKRLHGKGGLYTAADETHPSTLRSRLQTMPPISIPNLWQNKVIALTRMEQSLKEDHPRSLIQMATGSGKTLLAITAAYRLIKFAGARRILFLVDRSNLGEQTESEFAGYWSPDDNRKFIELYNVQRLQSHTVGSSSKVVVSTIQRLYAMLQGREIAPGEDEDELYEQEEILHRDPLPVIYNKAIPPEFFDFIIIDECHRSIYSLWRQVLEYFDAYLIGLTATPANHTYAFFNRNLVTEYSHEEAVADNVNVDFEIYRIKTKITENGATITAGRNIKLRDRRTGSDRWKHADEDLTYSADDLDNSVVAKDQIQLVIQTFKDRLFTDIFPGRKEVPKTLIFAKSDQHAEDIVGIVRQVFGKGDEFCRKITYRSTGKKPPELIHDFRNRFNPRIAVTVDMISTGTDIKPIEIVMFMRQVKSRVLFEQMKGRGVRVIHPDDLRAVTPDAKAKTHFIIVDCIGVTESQLNYTQPLERARHIPFKKLLEHVALGGTDPDYLSSLASRLARLDKRCTDKDKQQIAEFPSLSLGDISKNIVLALKPETQEQQAREDNGLDASVEPTDEQLDEARKKLLRDAVEPLATNPGLRKLLLDIKESFEQIFDDESIDELLHAGKVEKNRVLAENMVSGFESFLKEHREDIDALEFFYSQPFARRLRYDDIKRIHNAITAPPRAWTPDRLWTAYQTIEANKVKGVGMERRLSDIVSLIRFALHKDDTLIPYADKIRDRFEAWMAQQENKGANFTSEQTKWLVMIRDHIAESLELDMDDFSLTPFIESGGVGKAAELFGTELRGLIEELNKVLAA